MEKKQPQIFLSSKNFFFLNSFSIALFPVQQIRWNFRKIWRLW